MEFHSQEEVRVQERVNINSNTLLQRPNKNMNLKSLINKLESPKTLKL